MTTQVVVFSVLLFGTSGVVLDFGRVFSEHSQMQAYTDQAALAAAEELDLNPDSIQRAIEAVFDASGAARIPKSATFSEGEGDAFRISHLFFLSDLSPDSGAQFNLAADIGGPGLVYTAFADGGGAGGDIAAASVKARYVVAVAEERSVRNSLMRLINSAGSDVVRETNVVRTVAAAKREKISCGALSNLVICNPWEGAETESFESIARDPSSVGFQFRLVADGQMDESGALSRPDSLARRLALSGPAAVRQICSDPLTLPGADPAMTAEQAATAFAICMMASAEEEEYCVGGHVAIVAASAEETTTALSTAFDMWDWPIAGVLDWDRDAEGDHSQAVDAAGVSVFNPGTAHPLRDESRLFQPDLDILKARIWDEPTAMANAALGVPASSRLNHLKIPQYDDYNLRLNPCFRSGEAANCLLDENGEIIDHVSLPTTFSRVANFYTSYFPNRFFRDYQLPPMEATTFHAAYLVEREDWLHSRDTYTLLTGVTIQQGQSLAESGEDGSLDTHLGAPDEFVAQIQTRRAYDDDGAPEDVNGDGVADALDVEPAYSNFTYNPPYSPIDRSLQRRVMNATVVNCGSVEIDESGGARAPVAGFARLFLLQPPVPECADGSETCFNPDLVGATLYTEFQGESEMDETSYAVLVR